MSWSIPNHMKPVAPRAPEHGAIPKKIWSVYPCKKFWSSRDPTSVRPYHRRTNAKRLQPVFNLIIDNHIMVIDSCQNRVSADQSHMTVLRAQVPTH